MPYLPVGGQAVIEGVMMRSPSRFAVACRRADGTIAVTDEPFESLTKRHRVLGLPIVRGAVSMFETLRLGMRALAWSADVAVEGEARAAAVSGSPPGAAVAGMAPAPRAKSGMSSWALGLTLAVSLGLGFFLFFYLPLWATSALGVHGNLAFNAVDGAFRVGVLLLYLWSISRWGEMRRLLAYHGAEHKSIHALENGAELVPRAAATFPRFHPRCGTAFLFLVVLVSIGVFLLLGRPVSLADRLLRFSMIPVVAGVAFEVTRLSGRFADSPWLAPVIRPGLLLQRLTTREPDQGQLEVALVALDRVLDEDLRRTDWDADESVRLAFIQ